jgi:hypothetical protein
LIVVIASEQDQTVNTLVSLYWKAHDVRLLRPKDLSLIGWRHYYNNKDNNFSTAVIDGEVIKVKEIDAVLTRIPCVFENDLIKISLVERPYVAAEMTAFLFSWLDDLTCPLLNAPTPNCLSGPYWRLEQWIYEAAKCGMKIKPVTRSKGDGFKQIEEQKDKTSTITLVGDSYLGNIDHTLVSQTRQLASRAGVDLLSVHFSSPYYENAKFLIADIWPDITRKEIADAILNYLLIGK